MARSSVSMLGMKQKITHYNSKELDWGWERLKWFKKWSKIAGIVKVLNWADSVKSKVRVADLLRAE